MKKLLSIILCIAMVTALAAVPVSFASAENKVVTSSDTGFLSIDYADAKAVVPEIGKTYTDQDGNEFSAFNYSRASDKYSMEVKKSEVEVGGKKSTMAEIQSVFDYAASGAYAGYFNYIPLDENGYPFITEPNTTYSVSISFYAKYLPKYSSMWLGSGVLEKRTNTSKNPPETDIFNGPNYYWGVVKENSYEFGTQTEYNKGYVPSSNNKPPFYPYDCMKMNYYWNDKLAPAAYTTDDMSTITYNLVTSDFTPENNSVTTESGNYEYTYGNYFTLCCNWAGYSATAVGGETVTPGMYIKSISIKKQMKATFNCDGGAINGSEKAEVTAFAGDYLPKAEKDGFIFAGWVDAEGSNAGEVFSNAVSGKELKAVWKKGSAPKVYDFEGGEVIYTENDSQKITGNDGKLYNVGSWSFNKKRSQCQGKGVDGSYGLYLSATQTWGVNGCYPINDGTSFCYLKPSTYYTIKIDVKIVSRISVSTGCYFVLNPYYSGSVWSVDSTKYKMELAQIAYVDESLKTVYPAADDVEDIGDGWKRLTFKIETADEFEQPNANFPLPSALAIFTSVTNGIEFYFDNISVQQSPSVTLHYVSGKTENLNKFVGDKITLETVKNSDVIFEDGTGYTAKSNSWYLDEALTQPAEGDIFLGNEALDFYEKAELSTPYNNNQVSFYGFEDKMPQTGLTFKIGGYNSGNYVKVKDGTTVRAGKNGTLIPGVTYMATFMYKSDKAFTADFGGTSKQFESASSWTQANITFKATSENPRLTITGSDISLDTIMVSRAVFETGYSVLTSEAEETENAQALRFLFNYNDEDDKIVLNGNELDIAERGVVLIPTEAYTGELTKETKDAFVASTTNFADCYETDGKNVVYSNYIKGLDKDDEREITACGFVTLSDGNVYYSSTLTTSVNITKKCNLYKETTNTYLLTDNDVLDKIILQERYDKTDDGVTFDWTGATLKFTALCNGEVTVNLTGHLTDLITTMNSYFTVYVDGQRLATRFDVRGAKDGDQVSLKFTVDKPFGYHVIEVARQYERNKAAFNLNSFTIAGELVKTAPAKHVVEFIGDSVTCGGCNYNTYDQDGTLTYAFLTAKHFGVDYQIVSQSGSGLMYDSGAGTADKGTWMRSYDVENYYRSPSVALTQERKADVVVIFLGTNDACARDNGASWGDAEFKEGAETLINKVRTANPGAKVVWCIGGMDSRYNKSAENAINALGGEKEDLYVFNFGKEYHNGGNWHPSSEDHAEMADTMIKWFTESGLLD